MQLNEREYCTWQDCLRVHATAMRARHSSSACTFLPCFRFLSAKEFHPRQHLKTWLIVVSSFTRAYYFWHRFYSAAFCSLKSKFPPPWSDFENTRKHGLLCDSILHLSRQNEEDFMQKMWAPEKPKRTDCLQWVPRDELRIRTQDLLPFFRPKCAEQIIGNAVAIETLWIPSDTPLVVRCQIGRLGHCDLLLFCSLNSKSHWNRQGLCRPWCAHSQKPWWGSLWERALTPDSLQRLINSVPESKSTPNQINWASMRKLRFHICIGECITHARENDTYYLIQKRYPPGN